MNEVTFVDLTSKDPIGTDNYEVVKTLKLSAILNAVCEVNGVCIFDIKGKSQLGEIMTPRREYCYLACKLTQLTERHPRGNSLVVIGNEINRDHATVLHHKNKVLHWLEKGLYDLEPKFTLINNKLK